MSYRTVSSLSSAAGVGDTVGGSVVVDASAGDFTDPCVSVSGTGSVAILAGAADSGSAGTIAGAADDDSAGITAGVLVDTSAVVSAGASAGISADAGESPVLLSDGVVGIQDGGGSER
jgi:hypothetical protein